MKKKFRLDRRNRKMLGVCSGIAEYTGVDATIVRVAMVLVTIAGAFPWTVIAYVVAAMMAKNKGSLGYDRDDRPALRSTSTYEVRNSMREIDRRMAEVESYVTTQNSALAREIDQLR